MKNKIKSILGKHKVIGDTTYGLGYAEADQLTNEIIATFVGELETYARETIKKDAGEMTDDYITRMNIVTDIINQLKK